VISPSEFYYYKAEILRVIDGDTVDLEIDLGLNVFSVQRCRLYGIDAPERKAGKEATDYLKHQVLMDGPNCICQTYKDKQGKYGRWLVTIYFGEMNMNEMLVKKGLAKEYK